MWLSEDTPELSLVSVYLFFVFGDNLGSVLINSILTIMLNRALMTA